MGSTGSPSIIVVGAGIAGLATALSLSRNSTHARITVLESKAALNELGASIGIQPQSTRILRSWGLADTFRPFVTENGFLSVRDGATNEALGGIVQNAGNTNEILYGSVGWTIHRADYQRILADAALDRGVEILFDASVLRVDTDDALPAVILEDGRTLTAHLVIGADGIRSAVRASVPTISHVQPKKLLECCWRASVPKDRMRDNSKLSWLLSIGDAMAWSSPGRYVLAWPMPPDRDYDVVACVQNKESEVPPGVWGVKASPQDMRAEFQSFCPEVRELLDQVGECVKWQLADLDRLTTCRSDSGSVVLVGDAWHAMIPHSASGGNSAVEDGAVLGECVDWAIKNSRPISDATLAYEALRKARVERMQTASHEGYGFLGASGQQRVMRDTMLKAQKARTEEELKKSEAKRRKAPLPKKDMHARFPMPEYMQWLQGYDAIEEARRYCEEEMQCKPRSKPVAFAVY